MLTKNPWKQSRDYASLIEHSNLDSNLCGADQCVWWMMRGSQGGMMGKQPSRWADPWPLAQLFVAHSQKRVLGWTLHCYKNWVYPSSYNIQLSLKKEKKNQEHKLWEDNTWKSCLILVWRRGDRAERGGVEEGCKIEGRVIMYHLSEAFSGIITIH